MPKTTISIQVGNKKKFKKIRTKFRAGPRKSMSAHLLSNDQLMNIITDPNQKRYAPNAKQVLSLRGVKT